jgi:hypothetical protein
VIERLKPSGWILQVGDQFQPNAAKRNQGQAIAFISSLRSV